MKLSKPPSASPPINLRVMSDDDFRALFARRQSLVHTFSMGVVALTVGTSFADPEGMQPLLRAALGAVLLVSPIVYWLWWRPLTVEVKRRYGETHDASR